MSDNIQSGPDQLARAGGDADRFGFLHIDLNSFFASVEQQLHPEYRDRPLAGVPTQADTTVCIAASYQAKALGIKTGTLVGEAKKICPEIVLVEIGDRPCVVEGEFLVGDVVDPRPHDLADELTACLSPDGLGNDSNGILRLNEAEWHLRLL